MVDDNRASAALTQFAKNDAEGTAQHTAEVFEKAGARIEAALIKAAKTGELSFRDMAESILRDLARLAITEIFSGVNDSFQPPNAGASSTPSVGKSSVNIVMNISGAQDAGSFNRSQGQISAAIARAVSDGQRFF